MHVRKKDLTSSVVWLISVYFPQNINKKLKKKRIHALNWNQRSNLPEECSKPGYNQEKPRDQSPAAT